MHRGDRRRWRISGDARGRIAVTVTSRGDLSKLLWQRPREREVLLLLSSRAQDEASVEIGLARLDLEGEWDAVTFGDEVTSRDRFIIEDLLERLGRELVGLLEGEVLVTGENLDLGSRGLIEPVLFRRRLGGRGGELELIIEVEVLLVDIGHAQVDVADLFGGIELGAERLGVDAAEAVRLAGVIIIDEDAIALALWRVILELIGDGDIIA